MKTEPPSEYLALLFPLLVMPWAFSFTSALLVFLLVFLLLSSAVISGSEVAYFSLSPNDIETLTNDKSRVARRILALKQKPRRLLATILISNNFINIGIVILSDILVGRFFPEHILRDLAQRCEGFFSSLGVSIDQSISIFEFLITIVGVTFILLLFGEVLPKIYAKINNIELAKFTSGPLNVLERLCRPLSNLLVGWSQRLENKLAQGNSSGTSKEEIDRAIDLTMQHEIKDKKEIDILKSIVNFGDTAAKQIMTSRPDVTSLSIEDNYKEVLDIIKSSGFSRIPVYKEDFDHIEGILYAKDLIMDLDRPTSFPWQDLLRKDILYVPEAKKIKEILTDFQTERKHMAIVVDEFGGSAGIITLEDILEEVIGDIKDEFDDREDIEYEQIAPDTFVFEGKVLLNDFIRVFEERVDIFDDFKGESDSVAGLMLEVLGRIPRKGEEINIDPYNFKVISVNRRRIEKIQIKRKS